MIFIYKKTFIKPLEVKKIPELSEFEDVKKLCDMDDTIFYFALLHGMMLSYQKGKDVLYTLVSNIAKGNHPTEYYRLQNNIKAILLIIWLTERRKFERQKLNPTLKLVGNPPYLSNVDAKKELTRLINKINHPQSQSRFSEDYSYADAPTFRATDKNDTFCIIQ